MPFLCTDDFDLEAPFTLGPVESWPRASDTVCRVVLPNGGEAWVVTGYQDVRKVLADPRFSRAATTDERAPRVNTLAPRTDSMLNMDPPDHTRLRRLVGPAFTPKAIERLRLRIQEITETLLDAMLRTGPPADLIECLSKPLSFSVICELLGVPVAGREHLTVWASTTLSTTAHTPKEVSDARKRLQEYFTGLIAERRRVPTEDLLSVCIATRDNDDRLTEQELIGLSETLLVAGMQTTAHHIANLTLTLLRHPDQLCRVIADPEHLLASAVEELLRYIPLTHMGAVPRMALEDVELTAVTVRAGEAVIPALGWANRDPTIFKAPGWIDVTRTDNFHLAFGHGLHYCLGAQLARIELQIALGGLLRRCPGLRLAIAEEELRWHAGVLFRGPVRLPVAW